MKKLLLTLIFFVYIPFFYSQCTYTGTPLTQAGGLNTFCIDQAANTLTVASVRSGQFVLINVVKGFNYTFSITDVFAGLNENLTILDASTNANVSPAAFVSTATGASITWTATISGQIKVLLSKGACLNDNTAGGTITMILNTTTNTQDSETAIGTNNWVGHVYNWVGTAPPGGAASPTTLSASYPFTAANYVGYYNVPTEAFSEGFGGDNVCFPVLSNGTVRTNILTSQLAVRYRMQSNKVGCYLATFSGDDGLRIYVDGTLIYNEWKEQSPTTYTNVLLYLTGTSTIVFDWYENNGLNQANFSMVPFTASTNSVAAPSQTSVCSGVTPVFLNGSSYPYNSTTINPTIKYQWQSSTDNITFTNITGATLEDYTPAAITTSSGSVTMYYRRVVTAVASISASCVYTSNVVSQIITPGTSSTPSTITGTNNLCETNTNLVYSVTAIAGATSYFWTFPSGWVINSGSTTNSITVSAPVGATSGTITVYANFSCGSSNIRTLGVTVNTISVGGTLSGNQTICSGATLASDISIASRNGVIVKWQKSSDAAFTTPIDIATTAQPLTAALAGTFTANTYIRAVVQNSICSVAFSSSVLVTVNTSVGGTVSSDQTICTGTQPASLGLSANVGAVIKWQKSSDLAFTTPTDIANTTTTLTGATIGNLSATTYFRAVVQNSTCAIVNSSIATITVSALSVGGTVYSNQTICSGTQPASLSLSANVGAVIKWQKSSDLAFTTPTDIANTTTTLSGATIGNLSATTYFRAVVQNGACAVVNSSVVTITVTTLSIGGTVSSNQTICSGTQPASLSLSANVGAVIKWQQSSDLAFTTPIDIANTTTTLTGASIGNLSATTYFRAVVQNSPCSTVFSASALIAVSASTGGTVSSDQTICSGTQPASLSLSANVGAVIKWQQASDLAFTTPTDIANTTTTLTGATIGNLSATTYFRAVVQNGACAIANSSIVTITITPLTVAGIVTGSQSTCSGTSPSNNLVLTGNNGSVIKWQKSSDVGFSTPIDIVSTATTLTSGIIGNISTTTYFRAVVQNGSCGIAFSNYAAITIGDTTWDGTSWNNGAPTITTTAFITGNYTSTGNLFACSLTVSNNAVVVINGTDNVTLNGKLTIDSGASFTMNNNANLIQQTNVANAGNIIVKRNTSALIRLDYTLWSSPVTGSQTLLSFSPNTLTSRFYTYTTATDYFNTAAASTTPFAEAKSYLIRVPNTHPATTPTVWTGNFNGVPNNGNKTYPLEAGYNAVGNPYPSRLNVVDFIDGNTNTTGVLYFWRKTNDHTQTSYATLTKFAYTANNTLGGDTGTGFFNPGNESNWVINIGQGFMVNAPAASTLNFNNAMRRTGNVNQFFRSANTTTSNNSLYWLNMTNTAGLFNQMVIGYSPDATLGVDHGMDGKNISADFYISSLIAQDQYAVQARPDFNVFDTVPVAYKVPVAGNYTIAIDHTFGLFDSQSQAIYVKDNLTNTCFNLKTGSYSFDTNAGTFADRLQIVYMPSAGSPNLSTNTFDNNNNNWLAYKQNNTVFIKSEKSAIDTLYLYDIRGRLLLTKSNVNKSETNVDISTFSDQLLVVKIIDIDGNQSVKKL